MLVMVGKYSSIAEEQKGRDGVRFRNPCRLRVGPVGCFGMGSGGAEVWAELWTVRGSHWFLRTVLSQV